MTKEKKQPYKFKNDRTLRVLGRAKRAPVLKALVVRKYLHFEASVIAALFCGFTGVLKEHYLSGLSGNGIAVYPVRTSWTV